MLGTTRLQVRFLQSPVVRKDELLLKWSIRHTRRLSGYPFYRRLFLAIQMKTALETIFQSSDQYPTACDRYYWIISTIHISLFSESKPFDLVILMPATHFLHNDIINHGSWRLISYRAEPSLVLFQSVLVSSSLRLYREVIQHFYHQTMLRYWTTYEH